MDGDTQYMRVNELSEGIAAITESEAWASVACEGVTTNQTGVTMEDTTNKTNERESK